MPISVIAGNWKMNTTLSEATELAVAVRACLNVPDGTLVLVCPPFLSLAAVSEALAGSGIGTGAQNVHSDGSGAFTGEVSATMLSGICTHVIVGHSERRSLFGESDEFINRKARAAFDAGIAPILCVGERLEEREAGRAEQVVESQLRKGLMGLESAVRSSLGGETGSAIVAYEPVWAIGTGRAATPETAQEVMAHIRGVLSDIVGDQAGFDVPLLYGGSVSPSNIEGYMAQQDVNGALVGGASLDAQTFCQIVELASRRA
jgi:triosephosphate isomerase